MAGNFVQPGDTLTLTAPYDRTTGQAALVGSIVGIALNTVVSGSATEFATRGVWDVAKVSAQAWTVGAPIYWDDDAKNFTTTSTDNTLAGVAVTVAANPSSTGRVRLNGSF